MDFNKLLKLRTVVNSAPELPVNNQFNFGKYKGVPFTEAINKPGFKDYINFLLSREDEFTDRMARDIDNFNRFLETFCNNEEYNQLSCIRDRLNYIFKGDQDEEQPLFWFGKYRKVPLNKIPKDYKLWWSNSTLERHPINDIDYWNSEDGLKTYKLLLALDL